MQRVTKGANTIVPATVVQLSVLFASGSADVSAYILDGAGRVRGDEDMIFFNQPATRDGSVSLKGANFTIDLSKIAADVERIAICAVSEEGTYKGTTSPSGTRNRRSRSKARPMPRMLTRACPRGRRRRSRGRARRRWELQSRRRGRPCEGSGDGR